MIFGFESPGGGPVRLNERLSFPDCIFHIRISPVDDPARPKFPHAVTHTAYYQLTTLLRLWWTHLDGTLFHFEGVMSHTLRSDPPRSTDRIIHMTRQDILPVLALSA